MAEPFKINTGNILGPTAATTPKMTALDAIESLGEFGGTQIIKGLTKLGVPVTPRFPGETTQEDILATGEFLFGVPVFPAAAAPIFAAPGIIKGVKTAISEEKPIINYAAEAIAKIPETAKAVVRIGTKMQEMGVKDIMTRMNAVQREITDLGLERQKVIQTSLEEGRALREGFKGLVRDLTGKIQEGIRFQTKEIQKDITQVTNSVLPAMTRFIDQVAATPEEYSRFAEKGVSLGGEATKQVRGGIQIVRNMQTELDKTLTALKTVPRQDENILALQTELQQIRDSLRRLPEAAVDMGKELRIKQMELDRFRSSLDAQYDLKELQKSIQELNLQDRPDSDSSFYTKLKLTGRQIAFPAEGGLKELGRGGELLYRKTKSADFVWQKNVGPIFYHFNDLKAGVSQSSVEGGKLFDILEKTALPSTRQEARLTQFLQKSFKEVLDMAQRARYKTTVETGARRVVQALKNYVPHIIDPIKFNSKEGQAVAIEHLIRTGQVSNLNKAKQLFTEASGSESLGTAKQVLDEIAFRAFTAAPPAKRADMMLNKFYQRQKTGGAFFGNLAYSRTLDLPKEVLITDMNEIVGRYFPGAIKQVEHTRQFGQLNEKLKDIRRMIYQEKGSHAGNFAEQYIRILTGGDQRDLLSQWGVNTIKTFETITKLDFAFIANATQTFATTLPKAGVVNTYKAIRSLPDKQAQQFMAESGALVEMITRKMLADIGGTKAGETFLTKVTPFNLIEKAFNRSVAPLAGRFELFDMWKRLKANPQDSLALRTLAKWRVPTEKLLKLGPIERFQKLAAYHFTEETQFGSKLAMNPMLANSPNQWIRVMYIFKQFPINAGKFMTQEVLKEAALGNPRPLIRLLTITPIVGEIANDTSALIQGKTRTSSPVQRYLENLFFVGSLGLTWNLIQSGYYGAGSVTNVLVGPALGDVADVFAGLIQGDTKGLARKGLRQIPYGGKSAARKFIPTASQEREKKLRGKGKLQPITSAFEALENISQGKFITEPLSTLFGKIPSVKKSKAKSKF